MPLASNGIDLREYSSELADYYRDGGNDNGTIMGKMLFNMLLMNFAKGEGVVE